MRCLSYILVLAFLLGLSPRAYGQTRECTGSIEVFADGEFRQVREFQAEGSGGGPNRARRRARDLIMRCADELFAESDGIIRSSEDCRLLALGGGQPERVLQSFTSQHRRLQCLGRELASPVTGYAASTQGEQSRQPEFDGESVGDIGTIRVRSRGGKFCQSTREYQPLDRVENSDCLGASQFLDGGRFELVEGPYYTQIRVSGFGLQRLTPLRIRPSGEPFGWALQMKRRDYPYPFLRGKIQWTDGSSELNYDFLEQFCIDIVDQQKLPLQRRWTASGIAFLASVPCDGGPARQFVYNVETGTLATDRNGVDLCLVGIDPPDRSQNPVRWPHNGTDRADYADIEDLKVAALLPCNVNIAKDWQINLTMPTSAL